MKNDKTVLDRVNLPSDTKDMDIPTLEILANDVRECMINAVSKTGGHLGAGLGVVD